MKKTADSMAVDTVLARVDLDRKERPGKHLDYVYVLRFGDGPIKIGYSANIGARLKTIGASHYQPLTMIGVTPGDRKVEQEIHSKLSAHRVANTREWYWPQIEVTELARKICEGKKLPDDVQKSIDLYEPVPVEQLFNGTKGQGSCVVCGRSCSCSSLQASGD